MRRNRVAISSTSRSGRDEPDDPGSDLRSATKPLELVDQRPRILGVEQHQVGHGSHTNRAGVASPIDDRRLTRHQRGLGDGLLSTRAADRRQGGTQQCRQPQTALDAFADVHHRPADVVDHRLGGHTGQRQHAGQCEVVRRRQERVALGPANPAASPGRAAARARPTPTPSRCRWTSGRARRGRPGRDARLTAPASPNGAGRRSATTASSAPSRPSRRSRRRRCRFR